MPRGLQNWVTKDVKKFLKVHDFSFHKNLGGSHEAWIKDDDSAIVEINITKDQYPPRTLETMIQQSGIEKDHWKKWAQLGCPKKNKCCEYFEE